MEQLRIDTYDIENEIKKSSTHLIDRIMSSLSDYSIGIPESTIIDIITSTITEKEKEYMQVYIANENDSLQKFSNTSNRHREYVLNHDSLENIDYEQSITYLSQVMSAVDKVVQNKNISNHNIDFNAFYEELESKFKHILFEYNADCYFDIKSIINHEKENVEDSIALEFSNLQKNEYKKFYDQLYEILQILKRKNENKENKENKDNFNQELVTRIMINIDRLESESNLSIIPKSEKGNIVSDYLTSKTIITIQDQTNIERSIDLDDKNIYVEFAQFLAKKEISYDYTIFECIQEFMDMKFGQYGDISSRNNIYNANLFGASISAFYQNNSAGQIERSCIAHNLFKLMGAEDYLIIGAMKENNGKPVPHVYNVVKSKDNLMLYDSYNSVILEDGKRAPMVEIIEGVTAIDDFISYTPNLQTIPFLYGKKVASNYTNNREYISPNYYKNMNNNLSDKADEMIKQMEQGIDVEGTGQYNAENTNSKQMGYTMFSIISVLSVVACIGIIILGVMLR